MEEYQQMSIFDVMYENYKITKPIRLIELFAGIGSQAKALKNIGANFETYKVVEFDKYAIASYNAIHNTNFKTLDITQISGDDLEIKNTDKYDYIMTYSFPCQDLSLAGKQKGMSKGTSTRSGLLWEVERLLKECKELPQILLMENVPQVHSKDNINDFNMWINFLESLGYKNYWKDLNAKNYGIPQNRNRTFMISILGDYNYNFPKKQKLKLRLKDMLEDEVDESYYLSESKIKSIAEWKSYQNPLDNILTNNSISPTLTARGAGEEHSGMILYSNLLKNNTKLIIPEATKKGYAEAGDGDGVYINRPHQKRGVVQKGMIQTLKTQCDDVGVIVKGNYSPSNHNASRIVDTNGLAPTVMENHGTITAIVEENTTMKQKLCNELIEKNVVKENYVINHSYTNGLNGKNPNSRISLEDYIETTDNCSPCLTTRPDTLGVCVKKDTVNYIEWEEKGKLDIDCRAWKENCIAPTTTTTPKTKVFLNDLRIRKLTPKECFRLMGFSDDDYEKASKVNSKAQLYKQAGNSIVVNVLMEIFKQLF